MKKYIIASLAVIFAATMIGFAFGQINLINLNPKPLVAKLKITVLQEIIQDNGTNNGSPSATSVISPLSGATVQVVAKPLNCPTKTPPVTLSGTTLSNGIVLLTFPNFKPSANGSLNVVYTFSISKSGYSSITNLTYSAKNYKPYPPTSNDSYSFTLHKN